jgi:hypothetical protein
MQTKSAPSRAFRDQKKEFVLNLEFRILNLFGILDFEFGISAGLLAVVWNLEFGISPKLSAAQFRSGFPVLRVC